MPISSQARVCSNLQDVAYLRALERISGRRRNQANMELRSEPVLSLPDIFPRGQPSRQPYYHQRGQQSNNGLSPGVHPTSLWPRPRRRRLAVLETPVCRLSGCDYYPFAAEALNNVSNNWPNNSNETPAAPPATAVQSPGRQPRKNPSHDDEGPTAQKDRRRSSTESGSTSRSQKRGSKGEIGKKRSSVPKAILAKKSSRGYRGGVGSPTGSKQSNFAGVQDSSSESIHKYNNPPTYEIDLLGTNDSPTSSNEVPTSVAEEVTEEPKAAPEHRMPKIKLLYKQLLSIGMSANAFRGVLVHSATGTAKNATEEEAEQVIGAIVSDMVDQDTSAGGPEEEDEEVELVMGSLLSDVGNRPCIEMASEPPAVPEIPASYETSEVVDTEPAPATKMNDFLFDMPVLAPSAETWHATAGLDLPPPPPSPVAPKEETADQAFLKEVVAGTAFKTSQGKPLPVPAQKPKEAPKRKVFKVPPIRLRRSLPPADPDLLCIRTPNVDLTYEQAKNMLEAQLGNIVLLQHVPEYLQNGELQIAPRVMWIFKMADKSDSHYVQICTTGIIGYDGEKLRIRKRDDVFKEENKAFLLVKQIKEEQAKILKNKNKDPKAKQPLPQQQQPKAVKA